MGTVLAGMNSSVRHGLLPYQGEEQRGFSGICGWVIGNFNLCLV